MHLPRLAPQSWTAAHAWRIWAGYGVVVCVLALIHGVRGDAASWGVAGRDYLPATLRWWSGTQDLYTEGIAGFLYLPQSIWLFTPFVWLPAPLGHALWRLFGLALLALGLARVSKAACPERSGPLFSLATLLSLLCAFSATNTGQTNLHLVGFLLLALADWMAGRPARLALWLWLAMAAKPVALVALLLCFALHKPARVPLALGALLFALLPWLHFDWGYVNAQYGLAFEKLARAGRPGEKVYANLVWLLQSLGLSVPQTVRTALQVVLALGTLALSWGACRRGGRRQGAWITMALAASYMLLLSPRTETNTYVVLVPFVGLAAGLAWIVHADRRAFLGFALLALLLASDNYGRAFHAWTSPWLKPLVALVFVVWLVWTVRRLPGRPALCPPAPAADGA